MQEIRLNFNKGDFRQYSYFVLVAAVSTLFSLVASESVVKKRRVARLNDEAKISLAQATAYLSEKEYAKARNKFELVAGQSEDQDCQALALLNLAKLYCAGLGVRKNARTVENLLHKAGECPPQVNLLREVRLIEKTVQAFRLDRGGLNNQLAQISRELNLTLDEAAHLSLLNFAILNNFKEFLWFLLHLYVDVTELNEEQCFSLLSLSASLRNKEAIALLLDNGFPVKATDENGTTALHAAGNSEVVSILVENGASLDARDKNGDSPLHALVRSYRLEKEKRGLLLQAVNALLDAGANPDLTDKILWRPLHLAVLRGEDYYEEIDMAGMVDLLLSKKADVNAADEGGWTAVHLGASQGLALVVERLLANGGDPSRKDSEGRYPHEIAQKEGFSELAGLLARKIKEKPFFPPLTSYINETRLYWAARIIHHVKRLVKPEEEVYIYDRLGLMSDFLLLSRHLPSTNIVMKNALAGLGVVTGCEVLIDLSGLRARWEAVDSWIRLLPSVRIPLVDGEVSAWALYCLAAAVVYGGGLALNAP